MLEEIIVDEYGGGELLLSLFVEHYDWMDCFGVVTDVVCDVEYDEYAQMVTMNYDDDDLINDEWNVVV